MWQLLERHILVDRQHWKFPWRKKKQNMCRMFYATSRIKCLLFRQQFPLAQVTSNIWGTKFKILGLAPILPTHLGQVWKKETGRIDEPAIDFFPFSVWLCDNIDGRVLPGHVQNVAAPLTAPTNDVRRRGSAGTVRPARWRRSSQIAIRRRWRRLVESISK